jgi:beta-phosphoglucomutase-like phosphatase (HAD superfamily)
VPISQDRALAGLGPLETGFDLLRPEIEPVLAQLTESGAWLLTLSGSPEEAIALVRRKAEVLRGRAISR